MKAIFKKHSTFNIHFFIFLFSLFSLHLKSQDRPNIIHIIGDDIGYDDFSSFGSKYYHTPNIDKLGKEGVKITNFYAPHSTCTPSRAAFMTGRYAPRVNDRTGLGVLFPSDNIGLDSSKEITFTKQLKKLNYKTALFGKWHLGHLPQFLPAAHGFDEYLGIPYPNDHGPERLGNTGSRGFPMIPLIHNTEKIRDLDNNDLAEVPHLFVREACKYIAERVKKKEPFYLQYSNIETHTPWFIPKGFGGSKYGAFADAVEYFDRSVGVILDYVKQLGIEKNTIIIIHTDNGPLVEKYEELEACYGKFGEVDTSKYHILRDGKYQSRFEGGQRVPCYVKWPEHIPAGSVTNELITGADWYTSILTMVSAEIPTDRIIDGKNVMPLLTGKSSAGVRNTYYSFQPHNVVDGVRYNDWKCVIDRRQKVVKYYLYDLSKDPGEKKDLSASNLVIVKSLVALASDAENAIKNNLSLKEQNSFNF
jgi:arylsulfatase A-like enzyme